MEEVKIDRNIINHLVSAGILFVLCFALSWVSLAIMDPNKRLGMLFSDLPFGIAVFSLFSFVWSQLQIKISVSVRLPIARTIFWTLLIYSEMIWTPNIGGEPSYLLDMVNASINSVYLWYSPFFRNETSTDNLWWTSILPGVVIFGLLEWLMIYVSSKLAKAVYPTKNPKKVGSVSL